MHSDQVDRGIHTDCTVPVREVHLDPENVRAPFAAWDVKKEETVEVARLLEASQCTYDHWRYALKRTSSYWITCWPP